MLDTLTPHLAYKPCHEWIGDVPKHWDIVPGFAAFREKHVKNTGMAVPDVLSLSYGRIVVKPPAKLHGLVPSSFETYQIVDPGDIIIRPTDLQNDWHSIRVGLSNYRGIITSAYICLKPTSKLSAAYCHLLLLAYDMLKFFYGMGAGLRQSLDYRDLKRFPMLVPPPEEQAAIVRFLGAVDRRVNRFIRAKRRLIEVLTEQKQAIITQAVTRGLNPVAPLKPSGIDWLGEVPEHWEVLQIKRVLERVDYGTSEATSEEGEIRVLTMGNIQGGEVTMSPCGRLRGLSEALLLQKHDLLFTRTNGNPDLVGKVGLFRGERADRVSFASYLVRLRTGVTHDPQWLHLVLNSTAFWPYARSFALVNLQTNLNASRYIGFPIPVPPRHEQCTLVESVAREAGPLIRAIDQAYAEIDLIREYRTRLVADVVTGKVDVRGLAPAEPLSVDEQTGACNDNEGLSRDDEPEFGEGAADGEA